MKADVENVLFDLGDVVCNYVPDVRLAALAEQLGLVERVVRERIFDSGFSTRCDLGEYTAGEMWEFACARLEWEVGYESFRDLWALAFTINPDVMTLAAEVASNRRVGLLTNNPMVLREALPILFPEIEELFSPILFSYQVKASKPDHRVFKWALDSIGSLPHQTLFIDDSQRHVDGAQAVGMPALLFEGTRSLSQDLARMALVASR